MSQNKEFNLEESDGLPPASSASSSTLDKPRDVLRPRTLRSRSVDPCNSTGKIRGIGIKPRTRKGTTPSNTKSVEGSSTKANVHSGFGDKLDEEPIRREMSTKRHEDQQPDVHSSVDCVLHDDEAEAHSSILQEEQEIPSYGREEQGIPSDGRLEFGDEAVPNYNFTATEETKPKDQCLYSSVFEPLLNESAAEYCANREAKRLRRMEVDLLLGTLGMLNIDDVLSVDDITSVAEDRLASLGVSSVTFRPVGDDCIISTTGLTDDSVTISSDEFCAEETVVFNGSITPYVAIPIEEITYVMKSPSQLINESDCRLCQEPTTHYQFESRYKKIDIRHKLIHGRPMSNLNSGRMYENMFSVDLTLTNSSYGRTYNFLPTPDDMDTAIRLICDDDDPELPAERLSVHEIFALAVDAIRASELSKLLKLYFCMKNCIYETKGKTIRQVNMCKE